VITQKTVLILGAGASCGYGFPSGGELVEKIISNLTFKHNTLSQSENKPFQQLLQKKTHGDINEFREALQKSGKSSIDAFLEHRREYLEIGKLAIAQALIPFENTNKLFELPTTLYRHLYNDMNANFEEFTGNKLSVITFNYDRSFEHFMFTALCHTYGCSAIDAAKKMKSLRIIHVHGNLGFLPWQDAAENEKREYHGMIRDDPDDLEIASRNIKVIYDDIFELDEFTSASDELSMAERIVFLGFGYDDINLRRLNIDYRRRNVKFFGSCYQMPEAKIGSIRSRMLEKGFRNNPQINEHIILGDHLHDALGFLREAIVL